MAEMASLWGYAEHQDMDQLGQKLLFTTLELEKLKSETLEEMRKNKEYVNQLILLLKCAIQERDEARNQLGKLINKTLSSPANSEYLPSFPAKSSITESNSPPIDSLFDAVSSPDLPTMIASQPLGQEPTAVVDQGSLIIDSLSKGRALPQKGKLLAAVLEAGPLLQTLLLAGPLPRWRNPPQMQAFQIPPVAIGGGDAEVLGRRPSMNSGYGNFSNVGSGSCLRNGLLVSSAGDDNGCLGKRHRFF